MGKSLFTYYHNKTREMKYFLLIPLQDDDLTEGNLFIDDGNAPWWQIGQVMLFVVMCYY